MHFITLGQSIFKPALLKTSSFIPLFTLFVEEIASSNYSLTLLAFITAATFVAFFSIKNTSISLYIFNYSCSLCYGTNTSSSNKWIDRIPVYN